MMGEKFLSGCMRGDTPSNCRSAALDDLHLEEAGFAHCYKEFDVNHSSRHNRVDESQPYL